MQTSVTRAWIGLVSGVAVMGMLTARCGSGAPPPAAAGSGDAALTTVATAVLEDLYARNPVLATDLGIHKYDDKLRDYSAAAYAAEVQAAREFKARLEAIDPATLSPGPQLDREQLLHGLDSLILQDEVIRSWEKDPDQYSGGLTNTAYTMIKREFAPAEARLKLLTTRLQAMPAVLAEARRNLKNPPKIYTEIAIEQLDGNREFFRSAVVEAFAGVKDPALQAAFKTANDAVIAALGEYKAWLQNDLLKQSNGDYAYGADTYRKRLLADEMIDTPLDQLLAVAEADLKKNQAAFAETAKLIDAKKAPLQVLAGCRLTIRRPRSCLRPLKGNSTRWRPS